MRPSDANRDIAGILTSTQGGIAFLRDGPESMSLNYLWIADEGERAHDN